MSKMRPCVIFMLPMVISLVNRRSLAEVTIVCIGSGAVLPCPVLTEKNDVITWKYKGNDTWQTIGYVSKATSDDQLSPSIPNELRNVTNVSSNGSLIISSVNAKMNGIYTCANTRLKRVVYNVFAVNCEKKVCEGDDAIVECGVLKYENLVVKKERVRELVWRQGKKTLATADEKMSPTYVDNTYKNIMLSKKVRGALEFKSVNKNMDGLQMTCILHVEKGTPRRSSVTMKVKKCEKKEIAYPNPHTTDIPSPMNKEASKGEKVSNDEKDVKKNLGFLVVIIPLVILLIWFLRYKIKQTSPAIHDQLLCKGRRLSV